MKPEKFEKVLSSKEKKALKKSFKKIHSDRYHLMSTGDMLVYEPDLADWHMLSEKEMRRREKDPTYIKGESGEESNKKEEYHDLPEGAGFFGDLLLSYHKSTMMAAGNCPFLQSSSSDTRISRANSS